MQFTRLIPNIYYEDIKEGLTLFVDCLKFRVGHQELASKEPFCVLEKDDLQIYLFQHATLAKEHQPEFRFQTNQIDEVYASVSASHPQFLHPNLAKVALRPWGAREFALRDGQVCLIFQQW